MDKIIEQNKNKFNEFLKTKVSRESTVKQYLAWMSKIQNWFIEKKIVKDELKNTFVELKNNIKSMIKLKEHSYNNLKNTLKVVCSQITGLFVASSASLFENIFK